MMKVKSKTTATGIITGISLLLSCLSIVLCSCGNSDRGFCLDENVKSIIRQYIDSHPQYNTLAVFSSHDPYFYDSDMISGDSTLNRPDGFLIGPANEILGGDEFGMKISNRMVYFKSDLFKLLAPEHEAWENKNPSDSVYIYPYYWKHGGEYFIGKSWFVHKDSGNAWVINDRPDTIFLPKVVVRRLDFTIPDSE